MRRHGHARWLRVRYSLFFSAPAGGGTHSFTGSRRLASGRYELTLTVAGGASRSIAFTVR